MKQNDVGIMEWVLIGILLIGILLIGGVLISRASTNDVGTNQIEKQIAQAQKISDSETARINALANSNRVNAEADNWRANGNAIENWSVIGPAVAFTIVLFVVVFLGLFTSTFFKLPSK